MVLTMGTRAMAQKFCSGGKADYRTEPQSFPKESGLNLQQYMEKIKPKDTLKN